MGMCRPKGYGLFFCTVSVLNQVYTLPILIWNRMWFSRELQVGVYERTIFSFNSK